MIYTIDLINLCFNYLHENKNFLIIFMRTVKYSISLYNAHM